MASLEVHKRLKLSGCLKYYYLRYIKGALSKNETIYCIQLHEAKNVRKKRLKFPKGLFAVPSFVGNLEYTKAAKGVSGRWGELGDIPLENWSRSIGDEIIVSGS